MNQVNIIKNRSGGYLLAKLLLVIENPSYGADGAKNLLLVLVHNSTDYCHINKIQTLTMRKISFPSTLYEADIIETILITLITPNKLISSHISLHPFMKFFFLRGWSPTDYIVKTESMIELHPHWF